MFHIATRSSTRLLRQQISPPVPKYPTLTSPPTLSPPHSALPKSQTKSFHTKLTPITNSNEINTLEKLRKLGPIAYTPEMVLIAIGMRQGVWSVSPHKAPETHIDHHWETNNNNRVARNKAPLEKSNEHFDEWIGSVMRQKGLAGDPSSFSDAEFATDEKLQGKFSEIVDRIERYQAKPEVYVWCRQYLKDIFRFSNDDGMGKTFDVQLGGDDFKNMIRYKTFIEKERYKMMRDRECLMEVQLQFANNLDALQAYLNQINPRDTSENKFIHPNLAPVYRSISRSLAAILEVTDMVAVLYPFLQSYDSNVAKTWESGKKTEALELIQQQAAFTRSAAKISRGLLEYLDTSLYEFEEYYNPSRVRNLIEYARLESDPRKRSKLDILELPTPPVVEIDPEALYRAIGDATEGVVGNYEPESGPYYPIEHIPFSQKLLQQQPKDIKLTPDERNARFKLGTEELKDVRERRGNELHEYYKENMEKSIEGYSDEELDSLGEKYHIQY